MSLQRYVIKRVLLVVPTLLGVSFLTFVFIKALPGNAVDFMLQFKQVDPAVRAQLEAQFHLDEPIPVQYLLWLQDAVFLDFGESMIFEKSVKEMIVARLPATVVLGVFSWLVAAGIGITVGIVSATRKGEPIDEVSRVGALLGIAMPNFWLGLILLLVFSVSLGWFQVIPPADAGLLSLPMIKFMILPAITLGTASAALLMRLMRSSMVEELDKEYVRMARARGLKKRTIVLKHVVRNSLIPVVTIAALQIAFLVDGAIIVEQVFSWPGIGRLLITAIHQRDVPIIQAVVVMLATAIVFANLLADILYSLIDPRIRY